MHRPPTILVAEDDPRDAFLLKRAFTQAGIRLPTTFLSDGQEVIDYLKQTSPFCQSAADAYPALIMLDLAMPKVGGLEVLVWMREEGLSQIPVVVFSGLNRPIDISRAYTLGAKLFLIKPFDVSHWTSALKWLGELYGLTGEIVLQAHLGDQGRPPCPRRSASC